MARIMMNTPPRTNGCMSPLDSFQIIGTIVFILEMVIFVTCYIPSFDYEEVVISASLQGLLFATVTAFWMLGTLSDPTDWLVKKYKRCSRETVESYFHQASLNTSDYTFCTACQSFASKRSKHCRRCNRCVLEFDHHCIWLNNCIGKDNYKFFAGVLVSVLLFSSSFISWCIYSFARFVNNFDTFRSAFSQVLDILCNVRQ